MFNKSYIYQLPLIESLDIVARELVALDPPLYVTLYNPCCSFRMMCKINRIESKSEALDIDIRRSKNWPDE